MICEVIASPRPAVPPSRCRASGVGAAGDREGVKR